MLDSTSLCVLSEREDMWEAVGEIHFVGAPKIAHIMCDVWGIDRNSRSTTKDDYDDGNKLRPINSLGNSSL